MKRDASEGALIYAQSNRPMNFRSPAGFSPDRITVQADEALDPNSSPLMPGMASGSAYLKKQIKGSVSNPNLFEGVGMKPSTSMRGLNGANVH